MQENKKDKKRRLKQEKKQKKLLRKEKKKKPKEKTVKEIKYKATLKKTMQDKQNKFTTGKGTTKKTTSINQFLSDNILNHNVLKEKPLSARIAPNTKLFEIDHINTFLGISRVQGLRTLANSLDAILFEHTNSLSVEQKQLCSECSQYIYNNECIRLDAATSYRHNIITALELYTKVDHLITFLDNCKEITLVLIIADARRYAITQDMSKLYTFTKK